MRSIVFMGNCQVRALSRLYRQFASQATRQKLTFIENFEELSPSDRISIREADVVVEQILDFKPKADIGGIEILAERVYVPVVNCTFMWPFAGQSHPHNPLPSYLETGPYGGELGDAWLNRMIKDGIDSVSAVDRYLKLDVNSIVDLSRLYELWFETQSRRDEISGFQIAGLIAEHFRDEAVFRTPYHPNMRIAVALADQLFTRLGVSRTERKIMENSVRSSPFPKDELPIHPSVARHFKLRFVSDEQRWRFLNEGSYTTREFYLRYMGCEWNEPLAEGIELLRNGELQRAYRELSVGISRSPRSAAAHGAISHVFAQLGQLDEAISSIRRALDLEPGDAAFHAQLGALQRTVGDLGAAELSLRRAFEIDPTEPHYATLLANFLRHHRRLEEGINVAQHGIEHAPSSFNLHLELAYLQSTSGNLTAAEELFRRARTLTLDDDRIATLTGLAEVLVKQGKVAEAISSIEDAIAVEPKNVELRRHLSDSLMHAGKLAEAEEAIRTALLLAPDSELLYVMLSRVLGQLGEIQAGVEAARHALRLKPGHFEAENQLCELLIRAGDWETAEIVLRDLTVSDFANAHHFAQLAHVLNAQDRRVEAIEARQKAVEIEPRNPYRHAQLGVAYMEVGDFTAAEEHIGRALEIAPEKPALHLDMSHALSRAGRVDEAIEAARRGVSGEPDNPGFRAYLGDLLLRAGDVSGAEQAYRDSLSLDPGNAHIRNVLSRISEGAKDRSESLPEHGRVEESHPLDARAAQLRRLDEFFTRFGGRRRERISEE